MSHFLCAIDTGSQTCFYSLNGALLILVTVGKYVFGPILSGSPNLSFFQTFGSADTFIVSTKNVCVCVCVCVCGLPLWEAENPLHEAAVVSSSCKGKASI